MESILPYLIAAGVGALIAHLLSRSPDMRSMRASQLTLTPIAAALCVYCSNMGGVAGFACFLGVLIFLVALLAPNLAYCFGAAVTNFLDPMDWTPTEEEIALRPIRLLIDRDNFRQAIGALDELLAKHKPTYEAVLLKAKLLNHIGRVDEAAAVLPALIPLSQSATQQLTVMELLPVLDENRPPAANATPGVRQIEINHPLVIFQIVESADMADKEIPPGIYQVEEIIYRDRLWLKIAADNWGNVKVFWDAVTGTVQPAESSPKKGPLWRIALIHQAITNAIKGKPRRQSLAEAQSLFNEALKFMRQEDWRAARPLLQKASACDPDRYEIAYRWALSVRETDSDAVTAQVITHILNQSQWTMDEEAMLKQLQRQPGK